VNYEAGAGEWERLKVIGGRPPQLVKMKLKTQPDNGSLKMDIEHWAAVNVVLATIKLCQKHLYASFTNVSNALSGIADENHPLHSPSNYSVNPRPQQISVRHN
jgi:hypothetical protein